MTRLVSLSHRVLLAWARWSYGRSGNHLTAAYWRLKRHFLENALSDPSLLALFRGSGSLPAGYGRGFDERVVEYPWLFSRLPATPTGGLMLDAGSVLNFHELLRHPRLDPKRLHIVTLAPEGHCDWQLGTSYLFHDLRSLPLQDAVYETVVSLSTLEHIGMDNTRYTADAPHTTQDFTAAVRELRRVLAPGGTCYISVPYGRDESLGWYRPFDAARLGQLVETFYPRAMEARYYRYRVGAGWERSTAEECSDARCADAFRRPEVLSAEAVACLQLSK